MEKPTKPAETKPGEHQQGKYHYDPVGMAGKAEGAEGDPKKAAGREGETHRPEEGDTGRK